VSASPAAVEHDANAYGAGKSTTMRLLLGLDAPDGGEARINGRRYQELPWPLREVGALLEARAFHPGRSAYHHLLALAKANDLPRSRVDDVLEIAGLTAVAGRRAGTFSFGMGQRLGIAAALLGDPGCSFSTSRSMAWTRMASCGRATSCDRWQLKDAECSSPAI
jgi:ABC-2 type transport system ATP-binding protein